MTDYERELMSHGIFLIRCKEVDPPPTCFIRDPKRKVSPYAKFDKFHHKKKRK